MHKMILFMGIAIGCGTLTAQTVPAGMNKNQWEYCLKNTKPEKLLPTQSVEDSCREAAAYLARLGAEDKSTRTLEACQKLELTIKDPQVLFAKIRVPLSIQNPCRMMGVTLESPLGPDEGLAWAATEAGKICSEHQNWPRDACQLVAEKEVQIGMTADQVQAAWGRPRTVHRSTHGFEEWVYGTVRWSGRGVYGNYYGRLMYIFFQEGVVKSLSESRHGGR